MRNLIAVFALLCCITPTQAAEQHVVIVGVNQSVDPGVEPLEFADNDAARYRELLAPSASSITLLTVLDAESQTRFPEAAPLALPPTRKALQQAMQQVFANIRAATAAGQEADLMFIYTGHGGVDKHGEGYVSLLDGALTRSQLFAWLVAPSPARFNHLVIDACSAYYMVNRNSQVTQTVRDLLDAATLKKHPNTGALLATSRDRATHEWTKVQGGVFSYQVISALAGAADVDNDGILQYQEVGAFIEAANQGIKDSRARVDLFMQPPRLHIERPLWRRASGDFRLVLAATDVGRFAIVDSRGVAIAELNKNGEQPLAIDLNGVAPFVLDAAGNEFRTREGANTGEVALSDMVPLENRVREKSALEDALRKGLYTVPFGRSYVQGYHSRLQREFSTKQQASATDLPQTVQPAATSELPMMALATGGVGLVAFGVAAMSAVASGYCWWALRSGEMKITHSEAKLLASNGNTAMISAAASGTIAFVLLGTGAAMMLFPTAE